MRSRRPDRLGPRSASPPAGAPGRRRAAARFRRPTASEVLLLWAPTALGVTVALVIISAVAVTRGSGAGPAPRASIDYAWTPPIPDYTPGVATPTRTASPTPPSPATIRPLSPTPRRTTAKPRTTPPAPPPPPAVTGRYSVVDSYQGGFIGQVLVTNTSGNGRDWTVRLQFPRGVGRLHTFWVDGAPPPELARLGDAYVFTGRAPVAARGKLALRMQFERWGPDITPTACAVNGTPCA